MFLRSILLLIFALMTSACGHFERSHYRSNSGGYTGPGSLSENQIIRGPFKLYWPVDKVRVTQKFKPKRRRPHHGVDLDGVKNDPIYAAHEGYVIYAGNGFKGYGKMVIIQYDEEWASLYSHLNSIKVREGQYVSARENIGRMGRTGRATGVHLHFELMQHKVPVNPLRLIEQDQRLVRH